MSDRLAAAVLLDDSAARPLSPAGAESLGGSFSSRERCGECCNQRRDAGGLRPSVRSDERVERPVPAEPDWAVAAVPLASAPGCRRTRSR
jgi:hypothetical protein